jgi:hypothetical protein
LVKWNHSGQAGKTMSSRLTRVALVYVTYVTAGAAIRVLSTGRLTPTGESLALAAAVPAVQSMAVEAWIAVSRRSPGRATNSLATFFVLWVMLSVALFVTSVAIAVGVFGDLNLTEAALFSTMFIPASQALAIARPLRRAPRWIQLWTESSGHPIVRPILWIDAVIMSAGLILLNDPYIGVARAAPLQRQWVGTKLAAAAALFAWAARSRFHTRVGGSRRDSFPLAALSLILAILALQAFTGWMLAAARMAPAPIANQPMLVVWLEAFGTLFVALLVAVLRSTAALEESAASGGRLMNAATLLMFVALMTLVTNGAIAFHPVTPWAALSLVSASAASTLFAWASILAVRGELKRGKCAAILSRSDSVTAARGEVPTWPTA